MTKILLYLSLAVNLILGLFLFRSISPSPNLSLVDRIIDGDTFIIADGRQVRLMSVNAPEVGLCGGTEATTKLKELIEGKNVRLVGDINDAYGRFLALVYIDNILVNKEMISTGWARFTSTASVESENLKSAFAEAKQKKLGVFGPECYQTTNLANPKCNIKGNVRDGNKTYFFPGCGNYSNVALELDQGDQWFCSESAALSAGFSKAKNCYEKKY